MFPCPREYRDVTSEDMVTVLGRGEATLEYGNALNTRPAVPLQGMSWRACRRRQCDSDPHTVDSACQPGRALGLDGCV